MDKEYFLELLHRYRLGNTTAEECRFLLSYYKLFDRESDVLSLLNKQQQEELKQQIKTNIGDDINLREEQESIKSGRKMWLSRFSVAAVLLNYPSSFDGLSKREVYLEGEAY